MRECLLIRFGERPEDGVEFAPLDETGKLTAEVRQGSLTEAAMEAGVRRVIVLVPTADVLLTRVAVPSGNRQRVRKAVPFALEDFLAQDVEDLHFALGSRAEDGQWPVAVIARRDMDAWLERLREAGIYPERLVPEPVALPIAPDSGSLLIEADRVLLRDAAWSAQAMSPDTLPGVLELLAERAETGINLRVWHCGGELPTWMEQVQAKVEPCPGGALGVLAAGAVQTDGLIDLLQGAYSRKEQYSQLWKPWRAAAVLLLIGILVAAVQQGILYYKLKQESADLSARIEQIYRDTFPGSRMVDPRVQMQQQLAALRRQQGADGGDFLGLVGRMGGVLSASQGIELVGATFRDGRLDLELTAADVQTLDRLKQQLTAAGGLSVEIQSATAGSDQRVQGRLRLQGAES